MQSSHRTLIGRDTKSWIVQVWVSFGVAVFLCAVGLAYLPGSDIDRVFMVMGYFFCLSSVFVLAKYVRDTEKTHTTGQQPDTPLFGLVVWSGFFLALGLTAWGLLRMDINETYKAYLGVSWLYLISGSFTLAKTLRDQHEDRFLILSAHANESTAEKIPS